jgi:hypothetical protein
LCFSNLELCLKDDLARPLPQAVLTHQCVRWCEGNHSFSIGEIIMHTFRKMVCVLGLTMAVASVAFAQSSTQSSKKMDSSCCSCCSDSCDTAKPDAMKNHAASADKHDCGGCCGDSCDMKKMKNHASASDKDGCCACCGDSCDMKKKDAMKNHANSSGQHECCCCGDSCDMKNMKDAKKS